MAKRSLTAGRLSGNVKFLTAQKMIHRFLTQDRIKTELDEGRAGGHGLYDDELIEKTGAFTKEELAEKLGISPKELEKLKSPSFYKGMANKISLPLIRLYCATKFLVGEYKDE
jgi:hypothetical protein